MGQTVGVCSFLQAGSFPLFLLWTFVLSPFSRRKWMKELKTEDEVKAIKYWNHSSLPKSKKKLRSNLIFFWFSTSLFIALAFLVGYPGWSCVGSSLLTTGQKALQRINVNIIKHEIQEHFIKRLWLPFVTYYPADSPRVPFKAVA